MLVFGQEQPTRLEKKTYIHRQNFGMQKSLVEYLCIFKDKFTFILQHFASAVLIATSKFFKNTKILKDNNYR